MKSIFDFQFAIFNSRILIAYFPENTAAPDRKLQIVN